MNSQKQNQQDYIHKLIKENIRLSEEKEKLKSKLWITEASFGASLIVILTAILIGFLL